MTCIESSTHKSSATRGSLWILTASSLCIVLYGSYFYYLVRDQLSLMIQKQAALESIKVLTIPGSEFLRNIGGGAPFYSSIFFLVLLGMMFLTFLLLSLLFVSPLKRVIFLSLGFVLLAANSFGDRIWVWYFAVLIFSFGSFYCLTLPCRIRFTGKELLAFLLIVLCLSLSIFYGSRHKFFIKTRDRILFDSRMGNKLISFYYQYSPLAASIVTPERGIYQGLIFDETIHDGKIYYLGQGIFMAGNPALSGAADFKIARGTNKFYLAGRHGKRVEINSITPADIERAAAMLFCMKGILRLSTIGLYLAPGALLILIAIGIRSLTAKRKIFLLSLSLVSVLMLSFIWIVSLTGNHTPDRTNNLNSSEQGLSLAYFLYQSGKVPESFLPAVRKMAESESSALRYWGAYLLGICNSKEDAVRLKSLLEDPVPNIRYTAARSLYRLTGKESFNSFIKLLISDPNWYVRCKVYSLFLDAGMIPSPA